MSKKILFATDYSPGTDKVLKIATTLAREAGAKLLIAHVTNLEKYPVGELFDEEPEPDPVEMERLKEVVPPDANVRFEYRLLYGEPGSVETTKPADEIVKLARHENVETIVLGTHGHTALTDLLMGSVAELVLRNSPCHVVPVRLGRQKARTINDAKIVLDRRSIDALSRLLLKLRFSLAIYLRDGHQWTHPGDEDLVKTIHQVGDDHEQSGDVIMKLLADHVGQVPHGHFPMTFTDHDDTALDYLVPELIRHEQQMVEQVKQSLSEFASNPELYELIEELLGAEKAHVETLTEVQQGLTYRK